MIVKITCLFVILTSVVCAREVIISNKLKDEVLISVEGALKVYLSPFNKAAFKINENETTIVTAVSAECEEVNCTLAHTVAELRSDLHNDYYKISLIEGFNLPMTISPENSEECQPSSCTSESILNRCPESNQVLVHNKVVGCENDSKFFKTFCNDAELSPDSNFTKTCSDRKNFVIELQYLS